MNRETIQQRFEYLDSARQELLQRARDCASLTIPHLLPYSGTSQRDPLPMPYSSTPAMGTTNMASRMLSALMPLNDAPFFAFEMKDGATPDVETSIYLEQLSFQVYNSVSQGNLRSALFTTLQHLIVTGNCLLVQSDDMSFSVKRLDQYVVRRNVKGDVLEIICIEFEAGSNEEPFDPSGFRAGAPNWSSSGNNTPVYTRIYRDDVEEPWKYMAEVDGETVDSGEYINCPYIPLRWAAITGEDYGRGRVEEMMGDIKSLDAYTQALVEGQAAASRYYLAVNPNGTTDIEDLMAEENGNFIGARAEDLTVVSPANTMKFQVDGAMRAVEMMSEKVGKAFLSNMGSVRHAERVTATEIRMMGQELEQVLGGAFSAIANEMMTPIVERSIFVMMANNQIDPRLATQFSEDGRISISVVTGLQALSRDNDLEKLMRLGEMTKQLPEQAAANFKWDAYAAALVSALGFEPTHWVKTPEELAMEQQAAMQQQMAEQAGQAAIGVAGNAASEMAAQDIATNGGAGVMDAASQMGMLPQPPQ